MWWRTLLTIWRAKVLLRRRGPIPPHSVGRVTLRTMPTDIDLLMLDLRVLLTSVETAMRREIGRAVDDLAAPGGAR